MAEDPATKFIEQAKLLEQKGGERSDDSTTKHPGPSMSMEDKREERFDDSTAKLAGTSKMSKLRYQLLDLHRRMSLLESMEDKGEKRSGDSTAKLADTSKVSKLRYQELALQRRMILWKMSKLRYQELDLQRRRSLLESTEEKGGKRSGDATAKLVGPYKSTEKKGGKRSGDTTAKLMSELRDQQLDLQRRRSLLESKEGKGGKRSGYTTAKLAGPSKSKELKGVLFHTRRLTVSDTHGDTPTRLEREGEKSGRDTVLRGDDELKLHVVKWMSTDAETHLVLCDAEGFLDLISILAPLCPAVEHISIDLHRIHLDVLTHKPIHMRSVTTVCFKFGYCLGTLHKTLLKISKCFLNVESLDMQMENLRSSSNITYFPKVNSSSSLRELKLRNMGGCSTVDSLLMNISTSCPNIVSLVLSGFDIWLSNKSGKDIILCKMAYLTNIHLEPFETATCYRYETFMNVLHVVQVVHVTSPRLKLVEAKQVQLGGAVFASVKWSRRSPGSELQLEGASAAVPMADLMHLVSNELEGVNVLTFDRCKVDFHQSTSHPPQSAGEESSLRELKFLNVECPLSQTEIHKLSEMYPNVKVTVEHERQASHEDSKQVTRMPFNLERNTFPSSPLSTTYSIDEVNVKPIKMECCKKVGVEGGKLRLDSFGIELEIPPGAIDSEAQHDISLRVLTDTPNLGNSTEEMSVCFGVQCLALDDLVLKLPVTYTIPHCAVSTRYSSVKAVLYTGEGEYSSNAVVKERIILSSSGTPSCTITKDVLKLKMDHFSWLDITFLKNFFFRRKKMCCWPFKEKNLTLQKTPVILHAHLFDALEGKSELVKRKEGELEYVPAVMEQEVLINTAEGHLKMTCYVEDTVLRAVVSFDRLMGEAMICEHFKLDFPNRPDSVLVSLKVGQNENLEIKLLFRLDFSTFHRIERTSQQDQGASSSHTLQTSHRSPGETLENISGRQEDFGEKLTTVARKVVRRDEIDDLGKALGFEPEDIQRYVDTNMKNSEVSYMGTLSMLRKWRKKQTEATECATLKSALREAGQNRLANKLFGTSLDANYVSLY